MFKLTQLLLKPNYCILLTESAHTSSFQLDTAFQKAVLGVATKLIEHMGRENFFSLPQEFEASAVQIGDEDPVYTRRKARRAMGLVQIHRLCQIFKTYGEDGFTNEKDRRKWKNIQQQRRDAGSIGGPVRGKFITEAFKLFATTTWNAISEKHQNTLRGLAQGGRTAGGNLAAIRQRVAAGIATLFFSRYATFC